MEFGNIIAHNAVVANLKTNSKKQLIQEMSEKIALIVEVDEHVIFENIMDRERLGSTGVGNGVAIPHAQIKSISKISGMFAKLDKPVDYESIDEQPVDIAFMLLAPDGAGADHLKALSKISRLLRDPEYLTKLRDCQDDEALYSLLTGQEGGISDT